MKQMPPSKIESGEDLPEMFVAKAIADRRIGNFSDGKHSKYEALKNSTGYPEKSYIFSAAAMHRLIEIINQVSGIRVYFARYGGGNPFPFPDTLEKGKLILLFAPEKPSSNPPEMYFYLNNDGDDDQIYTVDKDAARIWIQQFMDQDEVNLRRTIDPNDSDNNDPDVPEGFSDTKSIFYTQVQIEEGFLRENEILHERKGFRYITSAYKLSLSSYGSEGNGNADKPIYKKRLFIQFDYMFNSEEEKEVYYLDDMDGFSLRKPKPKPKPKTVEGLDNGQLCPTHCP